MFFTTSNAQLTPANVFLGSLSQAVKLHCFGKRVDEGKREESQKARKKPPCPYELAGRAGLGEHGEEAAGPAWERAEVSYSQGVVLAVPDGKELQYHKGKIHK